jgi:hypothetical protein
MLLAVVVCTPGTNYRVAFALAGQWFAPDGLASIDAAGGAWMQLSALDFGLPGMSLAPGDHACAFCKDCLGTGVRRGRSETPILGRMLLESRPYLSPDEFRATRR